jgi:glycosyltransferase involved in cell wall biosynthesis
MNVSFFSAAVSRKNGGSSSLLDLAIASHALGRLSHIYTPLGPFDCLFFRASGSIPLVSHMKIINASECVDGRYGGLSNKLLRANRLLVPFVKKFTAINNSIYIDGLGVSYDLASEIRCRGGKVVLNHAGSPRAFIDHFGSARFTPVENRVDRYKYIVSKYDFCLFQSSDQIDEYKEIVSGESGAPEALLLRPSCYEPDIFCALRRNKALEMGRFHIAHIGSIQPRKNQMALIEICKNLLAHDLLPMIHIVGGVTDDAYHKKLLECISREGLMQYFKLYGHRIDYLNIMASCQIVIQTSIEEGVSRVLRESLALSKPVVAYNISGTNGIICHGINGFLAELHDTNLMASFCKLLASNDEIYSQMSINCAKDFAQNYSMQSLSFNFGKVLENVAEV